ncbi:hypothetical protein SAMN02745150_00615 [Brevinema andersonii]|uniref:Uncharacterized protein n=1 Tax=Brevinema andersonii TaxID=34097 RepID=A0A1I1DLD0_BREAD|nr:hypothetical protein [Brevinema andersonii]SFB75236.1 hypothetical protein SAMN02745150_00615 [Brevinema andersonii]
MQKTITSPCFIMDYYFNNLPETAEIKEWTAIGRLQNVKTFKVGCSMLTFAHIELEKENIIVLIPNFSPFRDSLVSYLGEVIEFTLLSCKEFGEIRYILRSLKLTKKIKNKPLVKRHKRRSPILNALFRITDDEDDEDFIRTIVKEIGPGSTVYFPKIKTKNFQEKIVLQEAKISVQNFYGENICQ